MDVNIWFVQIWQLWYSMKQINLGEIFSTQTLCAYLVNISTGINISTFLEKMWVETVDHGPLRNTMNLFMDDSENRLIVRYYVIVH